MAGGGFAGGAGRGGGVKWSKECRLHAAAVLLLRACSVHCTQASWRALPATGGTVTGAATRLPPSPTR